MSGRQQPLGNTYLSLSREVRKQLLAGCDEFDLAAAQLTLAAHVWEVPSLQDQVIQDKILGPWGMLAKRAGLPIKSKDQPIPQKPAIKKATYTLLFGGGEKRVKETLLNPQAGQPLTEAQAKQFMESDVVQDIIRAQKVRQERYIKDGGFEDAFGRWVSLEADGKRRDVKSLMAQELQSYELFILKPGLDYLIELGTDKVTVMAWQHDGLTLHFKDATKADRYIREMGKRITKQAIHGMGIERWQFALEGVRL